MLFSCTSGKTVYWCGDHPCINNKEKEAYFKKTMIVEVKEIDNSNLKNNSENQFWRVFELNPIFEKSHPKKSARKCFFVLKIQICPCKSKWKSFQSEGFKMRNPEILLQDLL